MRTVTLRKDVTEQIERLGHVDILIGIPSFNNARTIGHVVRAVQAGLAKYFPRRKAVLVNSDGGSTDATVEVVRSTRIEDQVSFFLRHRFTPLPTITTPYTGIPGKGSAFRTIFEIADALDVKACAVVDSDLRSITPEWIELLVKPLLNGATDFVAPLYHRHKYDGTITNSIVYPFTRALYGKRVRQPIGGDFGFSGKLARFYLSTDVWETEVARFGIDIWMTTTAIANGFKVSQSFLGAKIHDTKDPGAHLSDMLYQVVNATFGLMETYPDVWKKVRGATPVQTYGFQYTVGLEEVSVNVERMHNIFLEGVKNLGSLWLDILGAGDFGEVADLGKLKLSEFRFPPRLWSRIIYDYALAYRKKGLPTAHLLKSLTPLYLGKTASFIQEVRDMDQNGAEEEIEKLCLAFEQGKDYLLNNWQ
ncbi:MAG: glycosyltransferase [Smithellaceae bacterium]|nr:glycosyltransferase [Smithellaceae bacterium]